VFAFHLPDAVEAHGDDGDSQILGEEADAGLESGHFAGLGIVDLAFGEDQDAVAAVDGFSGEAKAFAEAGELREREDVEEGGDEPVAELVGPAFGEEPILWRAAHFTEGFAAHGGSEMVTIARGERGEDEADVGATGDVIGDDKEWSSRVAQIFAADDFRVAENLGGRPDQGVIDGEA